MDAEAMKNLKAIFLDIDGVIITLGSFRVRDKGDREKAWPACVAALNHITDSTGAVIVVSSTWRYGRTVIELREILSAWGVTGKVIDKTPVHRITQETKEFPRREDEIKAWLRGRMLDRGDIESFVILDDDSDVGHSDRHVKTSIDAGLTMDHASEAIRILGEPCTT